MEIILDTAATPPRLSLAGELTIYAAADAKDRLLAPLDACDALDLDLAAVAEIDSAGVQLLLLARQHAAAAGKSITLCAISRSVRELLELYELTGLFDVKHEHPAAGEST